MLGRPAGPSQTDSRDLTARSLPTYREEWSAWLTKVFQDQPTELITLTFAPRAWERDGIGPTGPTRSRVERAAYRFERLLTHSLGSPSFFIVREFGGMNGRAHLHSIVSSLDRAVIREGESVHRTKDGFVNIRRHAVSVAEYVSKYVSKSDRDFWLAGGPLWR